MGYNPTLIPSDFAWENPTVREQIRCRQNVTVGVENPTVNPTVKSLAGIQKMAAVIASSLASKLA
ncbi:hypothetical protein PIB30_059256, partial [Stylosanthes scabra]|nr:hypothetical protein [Stylosanthes scabra]